MNQSFDSSGLQFAFDSTSLGMAETCLRYYQYSMIDGWRSAKPSVHLWFGGHYATALEHFHKHLAAGMDREEALRAVVQECLEATWDFEECSVCGGSGFSGPESGYGSVCSNCTGGFEGPGYPIDFDHPAKNRANLIRTIIWYIDFFQDDPLQVVTLANGKPAVEYSFTIEIDDGLLYCGHIDRLVTYGDDVYVQDQKTSGSTLSASYFQKFDPDTQMSGYTFAGKSIYSSPVKGVIIDAAQIAVGFSRFERGFTFRTPAKLEEWYKDSLFHMKAARKATADNYFPMNRSSCDKFGGCIFRNICSKSPEVREQFLKADFVKREWDPLTKR